VNQTRTRIFVGSVLGTAAVVAIAVWRFVPSATPDQFEAAVFFSLAAFIAHGLGYKLPVGGFGDITFIPLLSGVAVAPRLSMVVGTAAAILCAEYIRRREPIRILFNSGQFIVAVGCAVLVYVFSGGVPLTTNGFSSFIPFVAAFATFVISNAVLFAGVIAVSTGQRFSTVLGRAVGSTGLIYDIIGVPLVFGFAYTYQRIGWGWSGALLVPLFGIRQVYKANRELQTVNEELLQLMVAAIEARDPYTSGHSQRVADYTRVVSRAAGLGVRAADRVYNAALLHDVGKIHEEFAPILRKPGRLDDAEFEIMKSHSEKGAVLVSRVSQFADLVPAIRGHHEAWDGSGYPDRLAGDAIPLWARIIALADTIDAMTTDRPYREALTVDSVREEVRRFAGRQFDPILADRLVSNAFWPEMGSLIRGWQSGEHTATLVVKPPPRHSAAARASAQSVS
jgi:HD superfamily phosphohydrolase YqeK